ncbi:MAG TPA: bifunctional methylenetetrahydrofolate dehydrogenase/methenyltetrahydrofolate cyclohydrolase FolD [Steroidobacteraceae bacterium]|nr:bifunctional methylenetetrahydrofolate dehydrogenase/methenyltetrahydrofolate cyclohydrolase FolD [Steroidobacteraceae bacterium]
MSQRSPQPTSAPSGNASDTRLIDGKTVAAELRARIAKRCAELSNRHQLTPGLAVVLVGQDPASQLYVESKARMAASVGIRAFDRRLPASTTSGELLRLIEELNADASVHGILVQLPLPRQIDANDVLWAVSPDKDVDGFHPLNAGKLACGLDAVVPCTPLGCLLLIRAVRPDLAGARALVVGRSNIVGKPMAQLLLREHCTVTIAHSRTRDLAEECSRADIVVAAIGRPRALSGQWIKPGAIVVDVGINRERDATGKDRVVGDVDFASALGRAGAITPVPGGVGPMTIACLLLNTLNAAVRSAGLDAGQLLDPFKPA